MNAHMYLQTQNSVYEIVSDVNSRQDIMEDRMASLEDKLTNIQVSLELLPDLLSRYTNGQKISSMPQKSICQKGGSPVLQCRALCQLSEMVQTNSQEK